MENWTKSLLNQIGKVPDITQFEILKPLGVGGYGKVYLVKKKKTGDMYAMKVLKKQDLINKNMVDRVLLERDILASSDNK